MIQNNYGNNKHSSSEGVHGKKEKSDIYITLNFVII